MPDATNHDAGLFALALFALLAIAGALYIEHLFARAEKRQNEQIDKAN